MKYYAVVSKVDDKTLLFQSLVSEDVKSKIYLTGDRKIGTVILNTKKYLAIEKYAIPILKKLFDSAENGGELGDIDWSKSDDGHWNFGWLGESAMTISLDEKNYKTRYANCLTLWEKSNL